VAVVSAFDSAVKGRRVRPQTGDNGAPGADAMFGHLVVQCKFAAKRPTESVRTQKTFDRAFKQLSIDIKLNEIHSNQTPEIHFLAEVALLQWPPGNNGGRLLQGSLAKYFDSGRSNYRRFA
jgi:hypothetical protein